MIALGFAVAFALSMAALAYWDVNRRRIANERSAADAVEVKYRDALNTLIGEVYDVVDKSRDDSTRIAYRIAGKEPPPELDPWIARLIAERAEQREARKRQRKVRPS